MDFSAMCYTEASRIQQRLFEVTDYSSYLGSTWKYQLKKRSTGNQYSENVPTYGDIHFLMILT